MQATPPRATLPRATARSARSRRGERLIAALEAGKGLLVLLVGFGLLTVVHRDVAEVAEALVGHFHLNPASRSPRIFLDLADRFGDVRMWALATFAFAYASFRLAEAYGLWRGRRWAEWFAVGSGAIYVPIEIYELATGPTGIKAGTLAVNVAIVAYMSRVLWQARHS